MRKNNVKSEDFRAVVRIKLCSLSRKLTHEPPIFKPFLCRRYTYLQYMSKPAFSNIFSSKLSDIAIEKRLVYVLSIFKG